MTLAGCAAHSEVPASLEQPSPDTLLYNSTPMQPIKDDLPRSLDQYALMVRLQLIPIEVPLGTVSRSERLWSYLDEEVAGVRAGMALNRNGFRVGRGRLEEWEPFGRLLRELTGKTVDRANLLAAPSQPVDITLQRNQDVQSIFLFGDQGELRGEDFPAGDNLLVLACRINEDQPGNLLVHAVPAVRTTRRYEQYVNSETGFRFEAQPMTLPLRELEFLVEVPRGQYLVIGPGPMIMRESSPAYRFLVKGREALRFETLLVIVPEVFAVPKNAGSPSQEAQ